MTRSTEDALRQELSKESARKARPPFAVPEDPRAFGRRVAAETFDRYVKSGQGSSKRKKR